MYIYNNLYKEKLKYFWISKSRIIILLCFISILLLTGGYFYFKAEEESYRKIIHKELESIGSLKINRISEWYADEVNDAQLISRDIFLVENLEEFFSQKNKQAAYKINQYLKSISAQHGYENILVFSALGELMLSANSREKTEPFLSSLVDNVIKSKEIKITNLYKSSDENKTFLDIISPVLDKDEKLIAVLLIRINAKNEIYNFIQFWPVESQSSEVFLIMKEDDSLRILSELKYIDNSNLDVKISLTKRHLPSVKAVLGYSGIYEGKGYTGEDVLAYLGDIPGTPWHLVTQVNQDEVYSDINYRALTIFIFTLALIIIFGMGLSSVYNNKQRNIYVQLYNKEKELWHSQEKFKITIDSLVEGVITTDLDGKVEYMNKAAEMLTCRYLDEAKGKMISEVYSIRNEQTGQFENRVVEKVLKQGIVKELANHTVLVNKEGKEIPVMDTGAPVRDKEGALIGVVVVFKDETEKRKQLRLIKESEERLRSTMDNMLEGCQIISRDWRYLYVNDAAVKHGKATRENLLGKTMMEAYPGIEFTELFTVLERCMNERKSKFIENIFTFPDGSIGWFELSIQPVNEGLFILSQDITERKLAEKELIYAKEKAEEMNRLKSNFFSNMNHELRTPITGILGFAEMMKDKANGDKELSEMSDYITHAGHRLLETLNLVLNISKLESENTEINLCTINIVPILNEIFKAYSIAAEKKNLKYDFICDCEEIFCKVDEQLFDNIFVNIINNAIKYTNQGRVAVSVEKLDEKVIIKIIDTGIGIPKEKHNSIWDEFRQVSEGMGRRYEGIGLGLTIAKKYTEKIGGKIYLESANGRGTIVFIEFPLAEITASV